MNWKKSKRLAAAGVLAAGLLSGQANASGETVILCQGALVPTAVVICAGTALAIHEAMARKPLGPNGEILKAGKSLGKKLGIRTSLRKPFG